MRNSYFTSLDPKNGLFETLKESNSSWWQYIKENTKAGSFYVGIRKDNSLNVYYNGGSLLKITLSQNNITCKIHEFYLGQAGSKYIEYDPNCLFKDADTVKERIASRYSDTSENGIKARLICNPNANYIDSEFAYAEAVGRKFQTTRIDLTKLENGNIVHNL